MKHILNKKMLVLAMAAALVAAMAAVLSGNGSGSQPVRTAGAAVKVRFDDTEILKSPLLTRYGGNKWKLVSTFTCTKRNECLSCDLIQFGNILGENNGLCKKSVRSELYSVCELRYPRPRYS